MLHMKLRRENFLEPRVVDMALAVYDVSRWQIVWLLCANVCEQHQNGAKLKAVHTDKLVMKHQIGAAAAVWRAY